MSTVWTESQLRAIREEGQSGNILVSAAAGSGKTAVLIERILRIIKDKTDIDRLLIVTFTEAAASEMRERLYNSIQKLLDSDELTDAEIMRLSRQQTLLSKSYITTIHSFCQSVIKSNPAESGIDSSFRIISGGELNMERANVMDEVMERWYDKNDPRFERLVEIYGTYNSDQFFVDQIFSLYDFACNAPDPEEWLKEQKRSFDPDSGIDFCDTKWCSDIINDIYVYMDSVHDKLIRLNDICVRYEIKEYMPVFERNVSIISKVLEVLKKYSDSDGVIENGTWAKLFDALSDMEFEALPKMYSSIKKSYDDETLEIIESVKEERVKILKSIEKNILSKIGKTPDAPYDDMKLLYPDMSCLIDVTLDFAESFAESKYEKHVLSFSDLEHMAYRTLTDECSKPSDVAKRYASYFEEIYVDEYQDTSEIQEAILSLISREKGNLFMVGDVKQSIYEFRQARPDLFMNKYKAYSQNPDDGRLIILNRNFRSRGSVINSVNNVFRKIMTERTCGAPYTENEQLNFGAEFYPGEGTLYDRETELYLIKKAKSKSETKRCYEAETIAGIIKNLIDTKYQVYDKNSGSMRDITYGDITVLMRAPSNAGGEYADTMQKLGVPAYYGNTGGLFKNAEVNILLSFMKVIDNPLQDIHFVAMMRNIYGFTDTQIAKVKADSIKREANDESFYAMCLNYSGEDEALKDSLSRLIKRLYELRMLSQRSSVSELLWIMMHENHFYDHLTEGPLGEIHKANVNILYGNAIDYDKRTNKGLFRFLYYFDSLKKRNEDLNEAAAASQGMNVVRIMSIHQSKGLEFPVVILAQAQRHFSTKSTTAPILKHRLLGLGPICYREDIRVKYPSVMKFCIARRIMADSKAEEMRILYVAMTRAAEKLIITGSITSEFDKYLEICNNMRNSVTGDPLEYYVLESKCFLDWLVMSDIAKPENMHLIEEPEPEEPEDGESGTETEIVHVSLPIPVPEMTFYAQKTENVKDRMPAKISVSELKRRSDEDTGDGAHAMHRKPEYFYEMPDFTRQNADSLSAAERGTAFHTCLRLTDYGRIKDISDEEARAYADELVLSAEDDGFLSRAEAESIDRKMLSEYFTGSIARRIADADEVMKEIPFTQLAEIRGELVSVQGIIDCLIKCGDKYTVIDFKTDEYPDAEKYRTQLSYYAECVKKSFGAEPDKIVYFVKHKKEVHL